MRRTLIITIILVIAFVALLLSLNFRRRQAKFAAVQQSLFSQCDNLACREAIENNFRRCINRYSADYREDMEQHPAGILTCMEIPSSDYASFSIIGMEISADSDSLLEVTGDLSPSTNTSRQASRRSSSRLRGSSQDYYSVEEASRAFGYGSE